MTIQTWINHAEERLQKAGCPDAGLDARYIAAGVLKKSPGEIRFLGDTEIEKDALEIMNVRLDRREKGEPLQYIENTAYFMDFEFYVDENVLIPRQDTETLVELALKKIGGIQKPDVLDMCTGSGAIAVSLSLYRKDACVTASDISFGAIEVAKKNAGRLNANVGFVLSDLFESIPEKRYDLITINPPYLTKEDMLTLQREVQAEPSIALFGGDDGLEVYRRIARDVYRYLKPGGYVLLEVGLGQEKDVLTLFTNECTWESGVQKDLCGVDRVVWIRSKE
ncbi:MAG: peptide chain release factor N(5)-glutamine methyltransferase [Clostridiales bacterium]|nr:peptide chain release factor N(5)-glutamine methyltransferase [Clostridiales bacterium]